jgi:hypothetical protein
VVDVLAGLALGGVDVAVAVPALRPVPLGRVRAALGIGAGLWKLRCANSQRERAFGLQQVG